MEEQHEVGFRATDAGIIYFFNTKDGSIIDEYKLFTNDNESITAFSTGDAAKAVFGYGTEDGRVLLAQHLYKVTYPDDIRVITPQLFYPLGETPLKLTDGIAIKNLSVQSDEELTTIAALTDDARLIIRQYTKEESLLGDEEKLTIEEGVVSVSDKANKIILDVEQREIYISDGDGFIDYYDVSNVSSPRLVQHVHAVPESVEITSLKFLSGGISILVGDSRGQVTQWFPVRDAENNYTVQQIRHFNSQDATITGIAPEFYRKGFLAIDAEGKTGIYHTSAHRTIKVQQIDSGPLKAIAIAPRANAMLLEISDKKLQFWRIDNKHPEISWQSIWREIWYESRDKPEYIWQSSSASSDFEPKFSLTPLLFGTLKAAFYAMLFAVPLAIFGAMYTAYFMSPRMRSTVKPTIEIMEALPTVILGFLAGLWFAPFVEKNLPSVFILVILLPVAVIISAYLWQKLPASIRLEIPDGWEAALLIPVVILATIISLILSQPVEQLFFAGNMPLWVTRELDWISINVIHWL